MIPSYLRKPSQAVLELFNSLLDTPRSGIIATPIRKLAHLKNRLKLTRLPTALCKGDRIASFSVEPLARERLVDLDHITQRSLHKSFRNPKMERDKASKLEGRGFVPYGDGTKHKKPPHTLRNYTEIMQLRAEQQSATLLDYTGCKSISELLARRERIEDLRAYIIQEEPQTFLDECRTEDLMWIAPALQGDLMTDANQEEVLKYHKQLELELETSPAFPIFERIKEDRKEIRRIVDQTIHAEALKSAQLEHALVEAASPEFLRRSYQLYMVRAHLATFSVTMGFTDDLYNTEALDNPIASRGVAL